MREPSAPPSDLWRRRRQHLRTYARSVALFAKGVLAVLTALLLYTLFVPEQPPLTMWEANDSVAQVLAFATPPPAISALVYGIRKPSNAQSGSL